MRLNSSQALRFASVRRWFRTPGLYAVLAVPTAFSAVAASAGDDLARVDSIIDQAIGIHGGDSLKKMTTIVTEWTWNDQQIFESRRPGPPWDQVRRWSGFAIAFDARRFAEARFDSSGGYEWITGLLLDGPNRQRLDYRTRTYTQTGPDFDVAIADAAALSPIILLRWLDENRDAARYIGRRQNGRHSVHVLSVALANETVEVFIEVTSGRIRGMLRGYTDYDGTYIPLDVRYIGERVSDGLHYPTHVEIHAHGHVARRASLSYVEFGDDISRYMALPAHFRLKPTEPQDVREFRINEITDGVYFVGEGVMYQLFVEFDEFLVALDSGSGDVKRRMAAVREHVPDKPVRFVLASHHHNDHLHALDEFTEMGATILVSPAHTATVNRYVEEKLERTPKISQVVGKLVIESGGRELHILDIGPTPHSEHVLAAYLPTEKILFEADQFVLGGQRLPVKPATENGIALFDAIKARDLDVDLIVDPHSPLIARMSDLRQAVTLGRGRRSDILATARSNLSAWQSAGEAVR